MKIAIAIFVKTPGISALKTRLGASIGQQKAEDFYRLSLKSLVSTLKEIDITPYWAVGEKHGLDDPLWSNFNKLHTGDGDLGSRQSHIYNELLKTYQAVVLIGADTPQLSQSLINEAITKLQSHDFVIGPAHDGGYYLLAGRHEISPEVWSEIPWSHVKTRETLIAKLNSQPYKLKMLTDVDTESDLKIMLSEMPENLNENQRKLKSWINYL